MIFNSPYPDIPAYLPQSLPSFIFNFSKEHSAFGSNGDLVAMTDGSDSLTFNQVRTTSIQFASGLVNIVGLQRNDVVLVLIPNSPYYAPVLFGAQMAGLVCATGNPEYTEGEIAHMLKLCQPKAIVATSANFSLVAKALSQFGSKLSRQNIITVDKCSSGINFSDVLSNQPFKQLQFSTAADVQNMPAFIVLSSGTTGLPKGVVLSHANIISNLLQNYVFEKNDAQLDRLVSYAPYQTCISCLPYFHTYGLLLVLLFSFIKGRCQAIIPKFNVEQFCRLVEKHRATQAHLVPPAIIQLINSPTLSKYDLSSIVFISSAAAPLSRETQTEAQKRLGCIVIQGYGMSEASPVTHRAPTENVVVGSAGYLMPSMQCKIIDDAGNLLGHSQVGEICMRGPNIMVGYLNNAAATVQAIDKDGFIHSGDIGYVDNNGCYYILDRKKELIKYKGFQVAPAELEGILMDHPAVLDAAVIPVYNKAQETEIPKAYVVVKPEFITSTLTHDIANWISLRVSSYKTLRGGVEIVRSIPKSASGKILRRLLREREAVRNSNNTQSAKL